MNKIASKDVHQLVQLGLTKQEATVYLLLWEKGAMTADQIAERISSLPQAASRSAKNLESLGLVSGTDTYPHTYQAIPPSVGLPAYAKAKTARLQLSAGTLAHQLSRTAPTVNTTMNLVMGKEVSYLYAAKLLYKTKREMLVISLGEPIPKELLLAVNKAHQRGVTIRMITQKYDETNKWILANFKKNGYEIRYAPSRGFSLAIYDEKQALLIIDRAAVHILSEGLSQSLRDYFYNIWETALPV
jgi:sugar-specific transcriptional regulator TrmB